MLTEIVDGFAICCYGRPEEFTVDHSLEYFFTLMIQGVVIRVGLNWEAIESVNEIDISRDDLQDPRVENFKIIFDFQALAIAIAQRFVDDLVPDHQVKFINFEYDR